MGVIDTRQEETPPDVRLRLCGPKGIEKSLLGLREWCA
jgi:hypothetical protein